MDFNEFKKVLQHMIQSSLPECSIEILPGKKINQKGESLVIVNAGAKCQKAFDLMSIYELYQEGRDIIDIANDIVSQNNEDPPRIDTSLLDNYEDIRDRLFIRVCSSVWNSELLEKVPYTTVADDLALTYHIRVDVSDSEFEGAAMIDNGLMRQYGITLEELHRDAVDNSVRMMPAKVGSMESPLFPGEFDEDTDSGLYVIGNKDGQYGASAAFYPGVLDELSSRLGDLVIIPSSIHEFIVYAASNEKMSYNINEIIRDVNSICVKSIEQLSDHAYEYRASDHMLVCI